MIASARYPPSRMACSCCTIFGPSITMSSTRIPYRARRNPREQPPPHLAALERIDFFIQYVERIAHSRVAVEPQMILRHRDLPAPNPLRDVFDALRTPAELLARGVLFHDLAIVTPVFFLRRDQAPIQLLISDLTRWILLYRRKNGIEPRQQHRTTHARIQAFAPDRDFALVQVPWDLNRHAHG